MKALHIRKLISFRFASFYRLLPLIFFGWKAAALVIAQPPAPVATYRINADRAVKGPEGHRFVWKIAPDNSLIILVTQPNGRWTIKRLTQWQTQSPKEQTNSFFDAIPKDEKKSYVSFDDPLIDPQSRYILVHRRTELKNPPPMRPPNGTGLVALLELQTLRLGATCKYHDKFESPISRAYLERASKSCPAFLHSANLFSLEELTSSDNQNSIPVRTIELQDVPGKDRYCGQLSGSGQQVLLRCGNVHFDLGDGVFLVFWKALAVLSVPDGKVLLSLPLHWNDTESSGLFAQAEDIRYLIVRHGFELRTYRLP